MNLPDDIISNIFSYLPMSQIYLISLDKNIINQFILEKILINKFKKKRSLGYAKNFYHKCFKCNKNLKKNYNLVMCYFCSIKENEYIFHPLICHLCCKKKLNRGEINFTYCDICNKPTSHLGITPFS